MCVDHQHAHICGKCTRRLNHYAELPAHAERLVVLSAALFTSSDATTENPVLSFFWSMTFGSVAQVTEQLLGAYSTDKRLSPAELIITHVGVHKLFIQCSQFATDPNIKASFAAKSQGSREQADVVLAQLPLHLPADMDYVLALSMAVSSRPAPSTIRLNHISWTWLLNNIAPP